MIELCDGSGDGSGDGLDDGSGDGSGDEVGEESTFGSGEGFRKRLGIRCYFGIKIARIGMLI